MNTELVERAIIYGAAKKLTYATRVFLVVLASLADDFGEVQISIPALGSEYGIGRNGVRRAVDALTKLGVLQVKNTSSLMVHGRLFVIYL